MLIVIISGIFILIAVFVALRRAPSTKVHLAEIPAIFVRTQNAETEPSYAMFIFLPPNAKSKDDAVNIQFSRSAGRIGVDWSLSAPGSLRDKDKFVEFAAQRGHHPVVMEAPNGFKYVRVEDGDLTALVETVFREFYGVTSETEMELIFDGFKWPT